MDHLSALELRLSNERIRFNSSKSKKEKEMRAVWIKQIEKEIEGEKKFSGSAEQMSEEELFAELS
jgi:hypothetical protein